MTLRSWDACVFPLIKMPQALLPFPPRPPISHVPRVCAASFLPAAGYDSTMVLHEDVIEKLSTGFSMFGAVTYKWEKRYTVLTVSTRKSSRRDLRRRCRRRPLYPGSLFTLFAADKSLVLSYGSSAGGRRQTEGGSVPWRWVRTTGHSVLSACARAANCYHLVAYTPRPCSARLEVVNEGELPVRNCDGMAEENAALPRRAGP